jgi:hypothetical protein
MITNFFPMIQSSQQKLQKQQKQQGEYSCKESRGKRTCSCHPGFEWKSEVTFAGHLSSQRHYQWKIMEEENEKLHIVNRQRRRNEQRWKKEKQRMEDEIRQLRSQISNFEKLEKLEKLENTIPMETEKTTTTMSTNTELTTTRSTSTKSTQTLDSFFWTKRISMEEYDSSYVPFEYDVEFVEEFDDFDHDG